MDVTGLKNYFIAAGILILVIPFIKAIAFVIAGKIAGSPSTSYFKPVGLYYLIAVCMLGYSFAVGHSVQVEGIYFWLFDIICSIVIAVLLFNAYELDSGFQKLIFTVACVIFSVAATYAISFLGSIIVTRVMQQVLAQP